jgi:hypothetical protein
VVIESVRERGHVDGAAREEAGVQALRGGRRRRACTAKLEQQHGDALAQALIDGDPEIDRELVGRDGRRHADGVPVGLGRGAARVAVDWSR